MNCLELDRDLDTILDRDASTAEEGRSRAEVRKHLEACPRCRRAHGLLLDWIDRFAAEPPAQLPARLASLPPGRPASAGPTRARICLVQAAAAGLLLALALGLARFAGIPSPELRTPAPEPKASAAILRGLQPLTPIRLERRDRTVTHDGGERMEATYRTFTPAVALAVPDPLDKELAP